ncbi:MAG: GTP cyclohydrolase I FolE [Chlamydiia bacterium]|nr:GTP cyclohydrolase I FolE [Chlamydiia bacterium]
MTNDPHVTRFPSPFLKPTQLSNKEKIATIAHHFEKIMETLGLDLNDESLKPTPERVARMYVEEVFSGLDPDTFPKISFVKDQFHHEHRAHMVFVKVTFVSFCEHHFVPFEGTAYVAYLPKDKLIGLSKIPRIVRFFAARPQIQERLTAQIADSLSLIIDTENIAVSIDARHLCVIARGIEDMNSSTITNVLRGKFETDATYQKEFFEGINRKC